MTALAPALAELPVRNLSERDIGSLRHDEGRRVVEARGHVWAEISSGFYQPAHLLARVPAADLARPTATCWGYRAALPDDEARLANGSVPVHLIRDLSAHTPEVLDRLRRRELRRCQQEVVLVATRDPKLLVDQGYPVYQSAQERLHYWPERTEEAYRREIARRVVDDRRLYVVGLVGGRVAGYLESFVAGGIVYTNELIVATDAMRTGINTGLYLATLELGRRSGAADAACFGLDTPERPGLTRFKESLGAPLVHIPARVSIPWPFRAAIRIRRPYAYYRLTGVRTAGDEGRSPE